MCYRTHRVRTCGLVKCPSVDDLRYASLTGRSYSGPARVASTGVYGGVDCSLSEKRIVCSHVGLAPDIEPDSSHVTGRSVLPFGVLPRRWTSILVGVGWRVPPLFRPNHVDRHIRCGEMLIVFSFGLRSGTRVGVRDPLPLSASIRRQRSLEVLPPSTLPRQRRVCGLANCL